MGYRAGGVITEETYEQYARYIRRWKEAGRPLPEEWFVTLTPETAHGARSALMWYDRETGGNVLELPALPMTERVPRALSVEQVAEVLDAMFSFNPRAGYTAALLYATGARVSEVVHIVPEDLSEKAVVLRHTKRRPAGNASSGRCRWARVGPTPSRAFATCPPGGAPAWSGPPATRWRTGSTKAGSRRRGVFERVFSRAASPDMKWSWFRLRNGASAAAPCVVPAPFLPPSTLASAPTTREWRNGRPAGLRSTNSPSGKAHNVALSRTARVYLYAHTR